MKRDRINPRKSACGLERNPKKKPSASEYLYSFQKFDRMRRATRSSQRRCGALRCVGKAGEAGMIHCCQNARGRRSLNGHAKE